MLSPVIKIVRKRHGLLSNELIVSAVLVHVLVVQFTSKSFHVLHLLCMFCVQKKSYLVWSDKCSEAQYFPSTIWWSRKNGLEKKKKVKYLRFIRKYST